MRNTLLLVFITVLQAYANDTYSQNTKLTLNLNNVTVANVLEEIQNNSEFYFLFNAKLIDVEREVSISMEDKKISEILTSLFSGTGVNYLVYDRQIILTSSNVTSLSAAMQQLKITGTVTDKNGPIPGANVVVTGTTMGAITDFEGKYSIDVPPESKSLKFSFIGMEPMEVQIGAQKEINVTMVPDITALGEVVVTALGISRESKSLVYAVQSIKSSQITEIRDPGNLLNSFKGKVTNALITQSSGGVGSEARIVLRGNRSIQGSNSALIVVDGVPNLNNATSNINPDDIESVTILRGASAGALYGSQAGNGVIVITTKKGTKDKISVNVNSGVVFESPFGLPKLQNSYGQGNGGILDSSVGASWGAKMSGQAYTDYLGNPSTYSAQPNNVKDFFNSGISINNSINVLGGTEKAQGYVSYTNNNIQGIIPTNNLISHTVNLRMTNQISKRFSTDAKITYFSQDIKNKTRAYEANNTPVMNIYQIPRNVSLATAEQYQIINNVGVPVPTYWPSTSASNYQNPYWVINNDILKGITDQISGYLKAKYQITDWLSITGMANLNRSFNREEQNTYSGTLLFVQSPGGYYRKSESISTQKWFDAIFEGNNQITENLKVNYNAGVIFQDNSYNQDDAIADGLNVTNKFSLNFATTPALNSVGNEVQTQSGFGQFSLSYKDAIYLEASMRNDWDSRLPSPHSFQYYSVGVSGILSDLITLPKSISFIKANINYAEVGNGGQFGLLTPSYNYTQGAGNGYLSRSTVLPFPELKPEIVKNLEVGMEARFIDNRLGFTLTYYKSNSFNQLLQVNMPVATGYSARYINAGNIENHGLELVLDATPIKNLDFSWNIALNFAFNRNKVIKLADNLNTIYLSGFDIFGAVPQAKVGGSYGDLIADQWQKDASGNYVVTSNGLPLITSQSGAAPEVIGNFNPKEILGLTNTFNYKQFSLRILIDGRIGGTMVSLTEQNLIFSGIPEVTAQYREGGWNLGGVDVNGSPVSATISSQDFWQKVSTQRAGVGEFFAYDATNFRVRELSFGYTIPIPIKFFIKSARISAVARNLCWLYRGSSILDIPGLGKRKMWFDPDMSKGNGNNQGVEYGAIPATRSIGFNLNFSF